MSQIPSEYENFVNINGFLDLPYMCNQRLYDELVSDVNNFNPKSIYEELGQYLLKTVLLPSCKNSYIYLINGVTIGLVFQRNYSGKIADKNNKIRPKRGLFDFKIHVANQLNTTHYQAFCEINNHSNLGNCKKIWNGLNPSQVTNNPKELLVLHKLMLMMFEQEVNWGDEQFQEFTAFPPSFGGEPRDMLMGFIDMMFKGGKFVTVDNIPDWKTNSRTGEIMTPIFGKKNKYSEFSKILKDTHFKPYRGKAVKGGLMEGEMRSLFLRTTHLFKSNN